MRTTFNDLWRHNRLALVAMILAAVLIEAVIAAVWGE